MTKRRDLVLALSALCAAPYVKAQVPPARKPKRIGMITNYLPSGPPASEASWAKPFWNALSSKGWTLGKNLAYGPEFREGDPRRLAAIAKEMVLDGVDLILTFNEDATLAAARATRSIPILFFYVAFPQELGLIDSFARPGRNVTGIAQYVGLEMSSKLVEYLRQVAPDAKHLSWIHAGRSWSYETVDGGRFDYAAALDPNIKRLGFEPRYHLAPAPQDIDTVFAEVAASGAQVLVATGISAFGVHVWEQIARLALQQRLPSAVHFREAVESGLLLSLSVPDAEDAASFARAGAIAGRLLHGENPAGIPVERPSRYEVVINLKTAKALGLTVPRDLLIRADDLIQ